MLFCILGEHTYCQGEGYSWNWPGQEGYLRSQVRIYVVNVLRGSCFFIFFSTAVLILVNPAVPLSKKSELF